MDDGDIPSDEQDLSAINTATAEMILNPDPQNDVPEDEEHAEDDEEEIDDELAAQEYASVDRALDEMLSFMDVLEERSDDLFAKMQELLADSRQTREEMKAARESATSGSASHDESQSSS